MSMNAGKKRTGDVETLETALRKAFHSELGQEEQKATLRALGHGVTSKNLAMDKKYANNLHECLAQKICKSKSTLGSDDDILKLLLEEDRAQEDHASHHLQYLLTVGQRKRNILHCLLDPVTYDNNTLNLQTFVKLKPFLRLLLRLHPDLATSIDEHSRTPLFLTMESHNKEVNKEVVRYLFEECGVKSLGNSAYSKAIESLTMIAPSNTEVPIVKSHALHQAIQSNVVISKEVVKEAMEKTTEQTGEKRKYWKSYDSCLGKQDGSGKTCLHLALTEPFTDAKKSWAETLVTLEPGLLEIKGENLLTPIQHFTEQINKRRRERDKVTGGRVSNGKNELSDPCLEDLEDWLKQECLRNFDNDGAKGILYSRQNAPETHLGFQRDDPVSRESLRKLDNHYKLDTILKSIYIPQIAIDWDDEARDSKVETDKWKCEGQTELFLVFDWLKKIKRVKKVIDVSVDDFKRPHSDVAIINCLTELKVETWDWRRMDISSDVIANAAGEYVKVVYLYCSGLNAVLQSWSDTSGLPTLKNLEEVYLETYQGLESVKKMEDYVKIFKTTLKDNFSSVRGRVLEVQCTPVKKAKKKEDDEGTASAAQGVVEQKEDMEDWLKCMDEFADIMGKIDTPEKTEGRKDIKVALIDDGVKSNYDGLDDSILHGKSWAPEAIWDRPGRGFSLLQPYNVSQQGHGTVMAWFIRFICPKVRLCIAKLDPQGLPKDGPPTFTISSAASAIEWAITEKVDIISMSWSIDKLDTDATTNRVTALRNAVLKAADANILLFCANPDKGIGYGTKTYPTFLDSDRIFCIGAAKEGHPSSQIDTANDKTDLYLPGVNIPFEVKSISNPSKGKAERPPQTWDKYSGSSLSCALAAGLAAMVLHCAQVSGVSDAEWLWLKSSAGMEKVFESLHPTPNRWLPVRRVFGHGSLVNAGDEIERRKAFKEEVVETFLSKMPKTMRGTSAPV
ncbi:hypothetical protein MMC18_007135 [Xylographa bjoerkii]|nr:hypothetical protein [Xylographa bjoerkii]